MPNSKPDKGFLAHGEPAREPDGALSAGAASGRPGRVFLVGAGPGDPGLITLRGAECLAQADLILYDYLVNPRVLEHAAPGAERFCLGHTHGGRQIDQDEINRRLVAAARAGKTVVRLKSGDPTIFGKGADETDALSQAGIAYEIVPGVTAALAAAGYAGIPITHGRLASAVALVAGQERAEKAEPVLDYRALAAFPGTLIFYMGVTSAPRWSGALMAEGKSPDTPVAIIRRATWPEQQTVRTTLGQVAALLRERRMRPPAIIVVGPVAGLGDEGSWFTRRPLFGVRVLVTRPRDQAGDLARLLADQGAEVLMQPAIRIEEPADWTPVDAAIDHLNQYDWLVFSSANGVQYFLRRLFQGGWDLRHLAGVRLAAIGPGTAEALAAHHLRADLVPSEYRAESLADELAQHAAGARVLLVRASRGREVLAQRLQEAGTHVEQVVVYRSTDEPSPDPDVAERLTTSRIDWITVTSSAIARSLVHLFPLADLRRARLASISPVTSQTLRELGLEPAAEAKVYTMEGLVEAVVGQGAGS